MITNITYVYAGGKEKWFLYRYGGNIKELDKARQKFGHIVCKIDIVCKIGNHISNDKLPYYVKNKRNNFLEFELRFYYRYYSDILIELKFLKRKKIKLKHKQFNNSFVPYNELDDIKLVERKLKKQKIINKKNG